MSDNAPTFDENGHLATVVVDAKKLSELTDELVNLRKLLTEKTDKVNALWVENQTLLKQLNEAQRQNELFRWLVDAWTFSDTPPSESDLKRMADAYAKIIEGGALK